MEELTAKPSGQVVWNENNIAAAICRQTLAKKCVVLVPNCNWTGNECDVLGVTTNLRIIDVEIKISRADLRADADKDKWWRRLGWGGYKTVDGRREYVQAPREALPWPPKVWKHYYAMPENIWKPELLACLPSTNSGVILMKRHQSYPDSVPFTLAKVVRRATPCRDAYRLTAKQVMDIARLANLRMWDAYDALARGRTC